VFSKNRKEGEGQLIWMGEYRLQEIRVICYILIRPFIEMMVFMNILMKMALYCQKSDFFLGEWLAASWEGAVVLN